MSLLRKVRLYNITSYVPTQTHETNQIILDNMNKFELSAILYYADFLSMQQKSVPVTDTCKYFYIHKIPMNISYIAGVDPMYDKHNPYVVQATETYGILKNSSEKMEFYLFQTIFATQESQDALQESLC